MPPTPPLPAMFHSPYSPFFTSGLLSAGPSRCSSPVPSQQHPQRRGSLPSDNPPCIRTSTDLSCAFYCTLQPGRSAKELRSFLSLDLAESQSLRSVRVRHKASTLSKSTTWSTRPELVLFPNCSTINYLPPLQRRKSRESFRAIPSPKPAPSMSLPDIPAPSPPLSSDLPPRLPPIISSPPLRFSSLEQASRSAPSLVRHAPSTRSKPSLRRIPSTRSARQRKVSRSDALARLEGRLSPNLPTQRNFMSMSDDEDDGDNDNDNDDSDSDGSSGSPLPIKSHSDRRRLSDSALAACLAAILDEEAVVSPQRLPLSRKSNRVTKALSVATQTSLSKFSWNRKGRLTMTESWFPLASFTDAREDESSWNWRSFIEIASVS